MRLVVIWILWFNSAFSIPVFAQSSSDWARVNQVSHRGPIETIAAAPDLGIFATGGREPRVYIWDAQDLVLLRTLEGHQDWIDKVQFVPETNQLVSRSKDGTVRIWDVLSGEEIQSFGGAGSSFIRDFEITSDGSKIILNASLFEGFRTLDLKTGDVVADNPKLSFGSGRLVTGLSDDGSILLLSADRFLMKLDIKTLQPIAVVELADELYSPTALADFGRKEPVVYQLQMLQGPDGSLVAMSFLDGHVELRSAETLGLIWSKNLAGLYEDKGFGMVGTLVSFDETGVLGLHVDEKWIYLDASTGQRVPAVFEHEIPTGKFAFLEKDKIAVAVPGKNPSLDPGHVAILDQSTGLLHAAESQSAIKVDAVAGARDAPIFVAGARFDGQLRVFDMNEKALIFEDSIVGLGPGSLSMSADGRYVSATGQCDPGVVWSVEQRKVVFLTGSATCTHFSTQLSADGTKLMQKLGGGDPLSVAIMDIRGEQKPIRFRDPEDRRFAMSVMSPDLKSIAVGTSQEGVKIYGVSLDPKDPAEILGTVDLDRLPWKLAASSEASVFAAGNLGGEVVVANFKGEELARFAPIKQHFPNQNVQSLVVSKDGETVYVGDQNGVICKLSVSSRERNCFHEVGVWIEGLALFENDRFLVAAERGARVSVFETETLEQIYSIEQTATNGVITDLRDDTKTEFGKSECIETKGVQWRNCQ